MALARKTDAPLKPVGVPLNVRRDANKWRQAMRKVDQGQSRKDLYALKTKIFTRGWQVIDKRSQQAKANVEVGSGTDRPRLEPDTRTLCPRDEQTSQ